MRDRTDITEADVEKLRRLVEGRRSGMVPDAEYLHILEQELDRADVVEAYRVADVIEGRVPKGIKRLKVLDVLCQPEAAGVCGN